MFIISNAAAFVFMCIVVGVYFCIGRVCYKAGYLRAVREMLRDLDELSKEFDIDFSLTEFLEED